MTSGAVEAVSKALEAKLAGAFHGDMGRLLAEELARVAIAAMPSTPSDQEKLISELREALAKCAECDPECAMFAAALLTRTEGSRT